MTIECVIGSITKRSGSTALLKSHSIYNISYNLFTAVDKLGTKAWDRRVFKTSSRVGQGVRPPKSLQGPTAHRIRGIIMHIFFLCKKNIKYCMMYYCILSENYIPSKPLKNSNLLLYRVTSYTWPCVSGTLSKVTRYERNNVIFIWSGCLIIFFLVFLCNCNL